MKTRFVFKMGQMNIIVESCFSGPASGFHQIRIDRDQTVGEIINQYCLAKVNNRIDSIRMYVIFACMMHNFVPMNRINSCKCYFCISREYR